MAKLLSAPVYHFFIFLLEDRNMTHGNIIQTCGMARWETIPARAEFHTSAKWRITEQPEDGIAVAQEVVDQEGDLLLRHGEIKLEGSLTSFNDSDCQRNELCFPSESVMNIDIISHCLSSDSMFHVQVNPFKTSHETGRTSPTYQGHCFSTAPGRPCCHDTDFPTNWESKRPFTSLHCSSSEPWHETDPGDSKSQALM